MEEMGMASWRRRLHRGACSSSSLILCCMWAAMASSSLSSDQTTLLDLSDQLKGSHVSPSWNTTDPNPCSWHGVYCLNSFITNLTLSNLHLSGTIPPSIALLNRLSILDLSSNSLTGPIPPLSNLSSLHTLDLSSNNLTGPIPPLSNLSSLLTLDLSSNSLTGPIPQDLVNLSSIRILSLSQNSLVGAIPDFISHLPNLQNFSAYQNDLYGSMPPINSRNLQSVNLAYNLLTGPIPANICASGHLSVLILTNNSFTGSLPEDLASCNSLSTLRVGLNPLGGLIPAGFGQLQNLVYFEANHNQLVGSIPSNLSAWKNLTLLNLADNSLSGNIPAELGTVSTIQELRLSNNKLTGAIPDALSQCQKLNLLDLSGNQLSGGMPDQLCNISKLMWLRLAGNSLSGTIPDTIGHCGQLLELQLAQNRFVGNIPSTIGNLSNLQVSLNLSLNQLTGPIPSSIDRLTKLVSLDVSNNQLSGAIPSLSDMASLLDWNFSNNLLSGHVPQIGPKVLNSSSSDNATRYANNSGLCDTPLPPCDNASGNSKTERNANSFWHAAGITVSCAVVALLIFSGVAAGVIYRRHLSSTVDPAPPLMVSRVFTNNVEQAISFDSIKEATCTNAHVISSNHFSTIYKAVMPSGLILAAKKLHSTEKGLVIHQRKLTFELEKLWRLSHENIMQPIGYLLQDDLAVILYDFVPLCNLAQQLHRNSESLLTWLMRYEIALGAAKGLAFLHHSCHPPMVHMDVSSNNIFLGPHFEVKIGDVEVAKLLDPSKHTGSISAVAGSFGYIAPEYAFTMRVTLASNVYSFGVVLLELLTGRLPIDETFGDGVDIVRWVHGASTRGETPEQILDARISALSFPSRQEMLAVLKVALLCTNASPSRRPRLKKVLEMLLDSKLPAEAHSTAD